ncbi:hypothetical protein DFP72DRAFT_926076 [Ephemerocybe angulata]|uniref:Uncharacterized protein n=1 Tax=Ephemerocybe angulata TaxID=980116 RepID=A0A8H6LVF9_9AGAR|nr:hypothetical protein DFP72DRAFT_926076 [Tulosesus angulatus]
MSVSVLALELSMTAPVLVSLGSAAYKVRSHSILPPKARFWRAVVALQHVGDRFGVGALWPVIIHRYLPRWSSHET